MKPPRFESAVVISVLLTLLLVKNSVAECRFEYTQQPPSTTIGDCNPYMGPMDSIRIQLDCKVTRQASAGVTDQFYIRWLRENTTGAVEDLGPGSETHSTNELLSQYRDLINENYKPSFLGKYWCQVINTTADPEQPLMRSNVFTLLAPDSYTARSRCSVQQTVSNTTCADLPAQSDQTTLPVPATTTDTATTQMTTASQDQSTIIGVTSNNHHTTLPRVSQTPAAPLTTASTKIPTTPPTTTRQTQPMNILFYVASSAGGVFLITIIILIVLIAALLMRGRKKRERTRRQTDKKSSKHGTHNNTYSAGHTPTEYAEVSSHNSFPGSSSPVENGPSHIYTYPQHDLPHSALSNNKEQNGHHYSMVTEEESTADLPVENYSHLEHGLFQRPPSSMYSKLDHSQQLSQNTSGTPPTTGELYSSLEDSSAPLYNRLEMSDTYSPVPTSPDRLFDDINYANLCGKQPERGKAVHPHYTGDYERAPDYVPPSIPITGGNKAVADYERDPNYAGDYERDPNYQPPQSLKSKRPAVPHDYSVLRDSTLDSPQEYTKPQH